MPFGRRIKAAQKRRLLAAKQPKRIRPRVSGNWNPVSEETMALLNSINRPAHMIETELHVTLTENAKLDSLKAAVERRLNELRIEEIRLREYCTVDWNDNESGPNGDSEEVSPMGRLAIDE